MCATTHSMGSCTTLPGCSRSCCFLFHQHQWHAAALEAVLQHLVPHSIICRQLQCKTAGIVQNNSSWKVNRAPAGGAQQAKSADKQTWHTINLRTHALHCQAGRPTRPPSSKALHKEMACTTKHRHACCLAFSNHNTVERWQHISSKPQGAHICTSLPTCAGPSKWSVSFHPPSARAYITQLLSCCSFISHPVWSMAAPCAVSSAATRTPAPAVQ
jgi:hypothetical protein